MLYVRLLSLGSLWCTMGIKTTKSVIVLIIPVIVTCVIYLRIFNMEVRTTERFENSLQLSIETQRFPHKNMKPSETNGQTMRNKVCHDPLTNMTIGRWVRKVERLDGIDLAEKQKWLQKEVSLENELQEYWIRTGILLNYSRSDHKCGYSNLADQPPNSKWPRVGSWCNSNSNRPCCNDSWLGMCMPPTDGSCACEKCLDVRKYLHPDVSDWIVDDDRCKWENYTASEACDVIEKSPFDELMFIGDSFMRNMFLTFMVLLTGDPLRGALCNPLLPRIWETCVGNQQYFRQECRSNPTNILNIVRKEALCGGRGKFNFKAYMKCYYNNNYKKQFYNLATSKIGKTGTFIILSVGFHMGCSSKAVISEYLGPVMEAIQKHYSNESVTEQYTVQWPHVMLLLPPTIGLLKPLQYVKSHQECNKYAEDMKIYAKIYNIPTIDMRHLTTKVHSFDGTHNGLNVNLMKNQILLNYIAQFKLGNI